MTRESTRTVVSGVQPSGDLHMGNLLTIKQFTTFQATHRTFLFVADLHALTQAQDPATLASRCREVVAAYIAAGSEPARSIMFVQSAVQQHVQLSWVLSCLTPMGWLNRMTQFKEKAGDERERAVLGLFSYPVLMAADILLYHATDVPVGEDQQQHVELTRDIAGAFNRRYGVDHFTLPEARIPPDAARVMSLRDASRKMSKSDPSDFSRINLTDDAETIALKIRRARTDALPLPDSPDGLNGRPETANLIEIFAALSGTTRAHVVAQFAGRPFSVFKAKLEELTVAVMSPISGEMGRLLAEPGYLDEVLRSGAERARNIAEDHMRAVADIIGFFPHRLGN